MKLAQAIHVYKSMFPIEKAEIGSCLEKTRRIPIQYRPLRELFESVF